VAIKNRGINLRTLGIPEIRHFVYKCKSNAQLLCSEITAPYDSTVQFERLEALYFDIHHRIHNINRPLKLIYEVLADEIVFAWATDSYELYATFEPIIEKATVISLVNKLLKWIKKEEDFLFIMNAPTF
jgi:vacuolar fusion protein MON1